MNRLRIEHTNRIPDVDWMPFPGGELEGGRPRALCPSCRARLQRAVVHAAPAAAPALCFECYRLDLDRNRRIRAAGELNTASEARFQTALPFERVNHARLVRLKADRQAAREAGRVGAGFYVEKRRRAQIEARNQLGRLLHGLHKRSLAGTIAGRAPTVSADNVREARRRPISADVRLPDAWLPFVVAG